MKKITTLILASALVFTLSACRTINDASSSSYTSTPTQNIDFNTSTEWVESDETVSSDNENSSLQESSTASENISSNDCTTLGHIFTESRTESTCMTKGYIKRVCTRCGEASTDYFNLKEHTYTQNHQSVSDTQHNTYFTCLVCDYSYTEISAHNWSSWTMTKQATQTTAGEKSRQCTICNHIQTEAIPALSSPTVDRNTRVLELVNIERQKAGLQPLEYYYTGQSAADVRAAEIIENFSHTRPNGTSCFTVFDDFNINYRFVGENIAYGYTTPEAVVEGWMNSEGHRENILSENFTHIIVGYKDNRWVQLFIGI